MSIDIVSEDVGELLGKGTIFSAIGDDPAGKGDDFVISYGDQAALTSPIVYFPVELWQAQDER